MSEASSRLPTPDGADVPWQDAPDAGRRRSQVVRGLLWLALANVVLIGFVFRQALWGQRLLVPLDIAPACFSHFRFVDPSSSGVIEGNAQFDQVVYDLPLQHGIYQAYKRGQIPWWDPYGYAGRPLLADGHINGTDPVRLLAYRLLPFELAYNWTLIGHFVLSGLTMFFLLASWRLSNWICVSLALTFEFAGSHAFFFGFPWLHGSMLFYPLIWLSWHAALRTGRLRWWGLASLAIGAVFYSGNLQSHAYLVLFGGAFAIGYGGWRLGAWARILSMLLVTGLIGGCLAAPVLFNQIEFFLQGVRGVKSIGTSRVYFTGLATLTSIYPWMFGDFRTMDVRSALFQSIGFGQNYGLGFHTFIGSAGMILALIGLGAKDNADGTAEMRRTGLALVILFLIIISSPLIAVFYTRMADLFVLGAIALAASGLQALRRGRPYKKLGWGVAGLALMIGLGTNIGAWIIYPKMLPRVRRIMLERDSTTAPGVIFKMPLAYREFQLTNLPNEVSFRNPEAFLAFAGLLGVAAVLIRPRYRAHPWVMPSLLALNLLPPVLFAARFVPRAPIEQWERLRAGGPGQQAAMRSLGPQHLRLLETAPLRNEYLFPDALQHLYQVQTVHGYSAVVPKSIHGLGLAKSADYQDKVADFIAEDGRLVPGKLPPPARFRWLTASNRPVTFDLVGLNEIRLHTDPGPEGVLLWTDTRYPGWTAQANGAALPLLPEPPCFTRISVPAGVTTVTLTYQPRFLRVACLAALAALAVTAWLIVWPSSRS